MKSFVPPRFIPSPPGTVRAATPTIPAQHSASSAAKSGMILAAAAFALLTSVDTIFKLMSLGNHPAYQILCVNGCFALVPIFVWTIISGGLGQFTTTKPFHHLARGAISTASSFAAIYAYSRLPLTSYYAILFTGPLIVTLMSIFILREKIDRARGTAILCGLFGVIIVTHFFGLSQGEAHGEILAGRIAAILAVLCYALSVMGIRHMRVHETNIAFSFYGYVAAIFIGGMTYIFCGAADFTLTDLAHLAFSGTLAGISSLCLNTAYHRTPVALVAPFQYTQIIWGAVAGFIFWHHVPDLNLVVGASVVAASGLYIIYREIKIK